MKTKDGDNYMSFFAGVLLVIALVISFEAGATGSKRDDTQEQAQAQQQDQGQEQSQHATADAVSDSVSESMSTSDSTSSASNDGNQLTVEGDRVENNSSNVVLVPNNNTESCVRVFGLAFGKNGESGAFGFPWRSRACDFEQAADDAFAAGERDLGWFWKCQNKNVARPFRLDGMSWDEAKHECHRKAVGTADAYATIDKLKRDLEFIQNERSIERAQYKESVQRLDEACNESKDRILDACKK
jgi:hypothetical protein